ncbi:MAG: MFS transporter [Dehalococcoidales bacterium]|nr:MFS transporter [Dehalococcoidales bacterium]
MARHSGHSLPVETVSTADLAIPWREPPRWLPPTLHSLVYRNYFLLLAGQVSNSLAQWMDMVARPIMIIALTGSSVQLGLVTLARGLPMMALGPFAGLLADRTDRRLLMLAAKSLSFIVNLVFTILIINGRLELWHIYVTAILRSLLMAFDQPARQALLPALVPPRLLMNAVALNTGTMQLSRIISASFVGGLIALWAKGFGFLDTDIRIFGGVYLVTVVVYIAAIAATFLLRVPPGGHSERTDDSWSLSFVKGIRFAWRSPIIISILVLLGVQSTFGAPYMSVFIPWLAMMVMDIGTTGAALLLAVSGVGSLAGAMAIATVGHILHQRGRIIIVGLVIYGAALAALGLTSALPLVTVLGLTMPLLPMLMVFFVGIGQTVIVSIKNGLLLETTPNELRGRIMSFQSLDRGLTSLGGSMGGFAIAILGGPYGLALFGILCAVGSVIVGVSYPSLRKQD